MSLVVTVAVKRSSQLDKITSSPSVKKVNKPIKWFHSVFVLNEALCSSGAAESRILSSLGGW